MSTSNNLSRDVEIDLTGMLSSVWDKKWWLLLITAISGVLFFLAFSSIEPRYLSESRIIIEKRESVFTQVGRDGYSPPEPFDTETIGSQVQILNSSDLKLAVIKEANLANESEFYKEPGLLSSLFSAFGPSREGPVLSKEEIVLKEFDQRLSAYSVTGTRVLNVEFWAHDRALAKKIVDLMAAKFIEFNGQAKSSSTVDATKWLAPEIETLRASLLAAEAKVADFRASSDLVVGGNNALLSTQQLSEFSTELSRVRQAKSSAEGKVQSIRQTLRNGGSLDVIPEVIASPLIQRLRERQITLKGEISELSATLLPNHPRVKSLQSQLSGYDQQIRTAAQDILKSLENNVDQAERQEAVLLQEVNRLKANSTRVGEAEVQLRALEREAASQRELLQSYLSRFREASSRQNADYNPVDARIISGGILAAESHFPKVMPFTIAGMVGVLLLSIIGMFMTQLLSGSAFKPAATVQAAVVNEEAEMEAKMAETIAVANAPSLAPARADLMINDDALLAMPTKTPANDESFFPLDVSVKAVAGLGRSKVAVVSPGGDEGSVSTILIARALSRMGKSCALVDLTGGAVSTTQMLGTQNLVGLKQVLVGEASLKEVLFKDNQSSVHVLASGQLNNSELGANLGRFSKILSVLEDSYEFVIVDCGYIGAQGMAKIADQNTIILIPTQGASNVECTGLERELKSAGFVETIIVKHEDALSSRGAA